MKACRAEKTLRGFAAAAALSIVAACAQAPDANDPDALAEWDEINDPSEPANRQVFAFNQALDTLVVKPAAIFYKGVLPPPVQTGVGNVLGNLRAPVILINDLLQGKTDRAQTTLTRFVVNSTGGILGINDRAAEIGYPAHTEDFGQTLAVWGMGEGPYLMLPVFGPSNPRDAVGMLVDFLIDPVNLAANATGNGWAVYTRAGLRAVDTRATHFDALEDLERSSLDFYASIRSLYRQRRDDEINDGQAPSQVPGPGISLREDAPVGREEKASR